MNKRIKMLSCLVAASIASGVAMTTPVLADVVSTSVATSPTQTPTGITSSHRLAGVDRYATAIAISQKGWTTSDTVIIATGEQYADALSAGPLAKKYNAPILLTASNNISGAVVTELQRLQTKNIIIVGGEGAVSSGVVSQLTTAGFSAISRIGGATRYETSTLIASKLDKTDSVVIVSGENFPDALSISSIASKLGIPIILSSKDDLCDSAKAYIKDNGISKAYIVGGTGVLSETMDIQVATPIRLAGADRYETNLAVLKAFEATMNYDNVYVSTGDDFADALAGAALASTTSSPIILADSKLHAATESYLTSKETLNTKIVALGGEAVIANSIVQSATDNKALIPVTKTYSSSGTYSDGNISGSVIISADGVYLKDTTISGDLLIASTVCEGSVDLDNVIVTGKIIINGGGAHSIDLHNMDGQLVELDKASGDKVRVATDSTSSIASVLVSSNGTVDELSASKKGNITVGSNADVNIHGNFDTLQINGQGSNVRLEGGTVATLNVNSSASNTLVDIDSTSLVTNLDVNSNVSLTGVGQISNVTISKAGTNVDLQANAVGTLTVSKEAVGSRINISSTTTVTTLNANASVNVTGNGAITTANISVSGVNLETKPTTVAIAEGITATVSGDTVTPVAPPAGSSATPVTPAAPAVTADDTANTVTGMTTSMEYNLDGAGYVVYDAITFAALDFSGNHTLLVRVAAEGINPAGDVTTLSFTTNPVTPAAPAVTADDTANTVTGMTTSMEYNLDGAGYVVYDATTFAALDLSCNHTLLVRVAAEGINPAGDVTTLSFAN